MRWSSFTTSAVALAIASLAAAAEDSDVINLTPSNFLSTVNPESLILVEFFAPWCGHCKALAPHYEEAATALKDKKIKLAKVDCVAEADLCQQHGVQGYPTLKVFRHGEPSDYTGPRKADGIISYMIKQSLPAVSDVTAANHEEFKHSDKLVLIAYLSSKSEQPGPQFEEMANKHRDDYLFGMVTDPEVIESEGLTTPAVVLYRTFDEPRIEYTSHVQSATVSELEQFVKGRSVPYIDEVGAENYQVYVESGLPLAYLFLDPNHENHAEYTQMLKPIAQRFYGRVNFVWIDAVRFGDHAKALNLPEPKWPGFVIQDIKQQLKYPLDQAIDVSIEAADVWVEKFLAGELQPQLKSQPIPDAQDESVYTIVGKTFDEVVFDEEKDVFIEFYAPWCGHCKRLKPTWDSLADRYLDVKDRLVIAKMDATENDLPPSVPFKISGFPTLKFRPAGSKDFIDYDGDRSLESLIEFVEIQSKNSLNASIPFKSGKIDAQEPFVVHEHDEL